MATMRRSVLLSFKIHFCLVVVLCVYSVRATSFTTHTNVGSTMLQVTPLYNAHPDYDCPYGAQCSKFGSKCAGGRGICVDDPLKTCYVNNFIHTGNSKYACRTINTTKPVSERACVGVPKPVSNVQVIILQGLDTNHISMNITWDPPLEAVGPLLYQISVRGYLDDPRIPNRNVAEYADENTFYKVIENQEKRLNYKIYVTALTAAGASEPDRPVQITNTKPDFQGDVPIKPFHEVTSFGVRLCTSCLDDPKLGLVTAAAIIVCNADFTHYCPKSFVGKDWKSQLFYRQNAIPRVRTSEDLDRFSTWAAVKKGFSYGPYRTTEDGFFNWIKTAKDQFLFSKFHYVIGGGTCDEDDHQKFCNGPVFPNSNFRVNFILCNNVGCTETSSDIGTFTTKPAPRGVNYKGISIGLSVALAFTFLFSFTLAVYAISLKRSASDPFKYEKASKAQRL